MTIPSMIPHALHFECFATRLRLIAHRPDLPRRAPEFSEN